MAKVDEVKLRKALGFDPFDKQKEIIACESREVTIAAGRRFGKSAICAYMCLRELLKKDKKIWIVAPTYDLTNKVFDYLVQWYLKAIPDGGAGISYRPFPKIKTGWGSSVTCRSTENPTGLLGEEVDLEIVDEAARIPRHIYDTYLYPVTSSRKGKIVLISTPFGKNWFFEKYMAAKATGGAFTFPSNSNPFFPPEEWEYAKNRLPEQVFKQEYAALFLDDAASVFRRINDIVDENCLEDYRADKKYIMGVDLGRYNDFTVLTVIDTFSHKVVYWDRFKETNFSLQKKRIMALSNRYGKARMIIDSTGMGDPIAEDIRNEGYLVEDFTISGKSKKQLIEKLAVFIEQRGVAIPRNETLIDELAAYGYEVTDAGNMKYGAPAGLYDDCVISLALAVWGLDSPKKNNPNRLVPVAKKVVPFQYL